MRYARRAVASSGALALAGLFGGCSLVATFDRSRIAGDLGDVDGAPADEGGMPDGAAPADAPAGDVLDAADAALPTNTFIVTVGGVRNGLERADVYVARIFSDGSLGAWVTAAPLPAARLKVGASAVGAKLVVTGGAGDEAIVKTTYVGSFAGGTVVDWTESTALPNDLFRHGSFAHDGRVYVVGGEDGIDVRSEVLVATPAPSGAITIWTTTESLPKSRTAGVVVTSGAHVYVVSGSEPDGDGGVVSTGTSLAAGLLTDGGLSSWQATTSLPFATNHAAGAATATHLYVAGGYGAPSGSKIVVSSPIGAGGALGVWSTTSELNVGRAGHAMLVSANHLYVIGGQEKSGLDAVSVELADIRPDGTLTPFRQTSPLPSGRAFLEATLVSP